MKIQGPSSGSPADGTPVSPVQTEKLAAAKATADAPFGDKIDAAIAASPAGAVAPAARATAGQAEHFAADIGANLGAGRITPDAAINQVIHRILDRQIGADAPAAVRQRVDAALRDALESDPMLLEKVRSLGAR